MDTPQFTIEITDEEIEIAAGNEANWTNVRRIPDGAIIPAYYVKFTVHFICIYVNIEKSIIVFSKITKLSQGGVYELITIDGELAIIDTADATHVKMKKFNEGAAT